MPSLVWHGRNGYTKMPRHRRLGAVPHPSNIGVPFSVSRVSPGGLHESRR
jgi:hypothetical protein